MKRAANSIGALGALGLSLGLSLGCGFLSATTAGCSSAATEDPKSVAQIPAGPSATIGPLEIAAGEEKTVCVYVRLDNEVPLMATKIHAQLATGSHHLIIYRATATEEELTPKRCEPFGGIVSGAEVPIAITAVAAYEFDFPAGVGLELAPKQMLKLEAHYINTGKAPLQGKGSVQFEGVPKSKADGLAQADIGFWGTTKIAIAPGAAFQTGVKFQPGIAGTKSFAVTTHQHRFGTRFRIWASTPMADGGEEPKSTPLTDESDWHEPRLAPVAPAYEFDGKNGLAYECEWKNTSTEKVIFGESALDEMCFLFSYYYPSHGFDLCLDGHCLNRK